MTDASRITYTPARPADYTGGNVGEVDDALDECVKGPASSTDSAVPAFDGTTGKLLKNTGVIVAGASLDQLNLTKIVMAGLLQLDPSAGVAVDTDSDSTITAAVDDQIVIQTGGTTRMTISNSGINLDDEPLTNVNNINGASTDAGLTYKSGVGLVWSALETFLETIGWHFAIQASDLDLTNQTTLQNTDLTFTATANTVYFVVGMVRYDSTATADIKLQMTGPSGSSCQVIHYSGRENIALSSGGLEAMLLTMGSPEWQNTTAFNNNGLLLGRVTIDSTGGAVTLQAAQQTAEAGSNVTTFYGGSAWLVVPIG